MIYNLKKYKNLLKNAFLKKIESSITIFVFLQKLKKSKCKPSI